MQNASKVANGYKTILTNLMTKDLEDKFNEFGLTTRKQNGELKDGFTILEELSKKYRELGTALSEDGESTVSLNDDMNKLLKDISGTHNINVLTSGFDNFEQAINASNDALNSAGSAQEEYEIALDTINKKVEALIGQFQRLVVGDNGLTILIKTILDAGTAILKFANKDIGRTVTKIGLLVGSFKLLESILKKTGQSIARTKLQQEGYSVSASITATQNMGLSASFVTLTGAIKATTVALLHNPLFWGAIALTGVFVAIEAMNNFKEKTKELTDSLDPLNKEISELNSKSEDTGLTKLEQDRLAYLEKELELTKQVILARRGLVEGGDSSAPSYTTGEASDSTTGGMSYGANAPQTSTSTNTKKVEEVKEEKDEIVSLTDAYNELQSEIENTNSADINSIDILDDKRAEQDDIVNILKSEQRELQNKIDNGEELNEVEQKHLNLINETIGSKEEQEEMDSLEVQRMEEKQEQTEAVNQAYEDAIDEVSNLGKSYRTLSGAVDEYNSTGMLSLDTLDDLLSLGSDYLSLLDFENGQLSLNEEGFYALANARIDEAESTAIQKAQNDLLIASNYGLADSEATAGNTANASVSGFGNASVAIADLAQQAINGALSIESLFKALGQSTEGITYYDPNITKGLVNQLTVLEGLRGNIGKAVKATKGSTRANRDNTKARKDNSDATKAQTQALKAQKKALEDEAKVLEKQIDDYETVIDYIKDLLQEEKEALEDERDAEIKINQDKIDDLEYNNEKYEKEVEHKLHLLELEKEEWEDYWDAQIDEMKQANNTLEENIKLQQLQEALARAKTQKVKVLKGGQFVYAQDEEAISKAEQELADYEMELSVSRQIAKLEELKKEALDNIDKQRKALEEDRYNKKRIYEQEVEDLEEANKDIKEKYDAKIEQYETYEKDFQKMLNRNARKHAKTLANELLGEQTNWDARMKALSKFVSDYDAKKQQLNTIKTEIGNLDDAIRGAESSARSAMNNARNYATQASNYADNAGLHVERAQKSMLGWKVTGIFASGAGQAETASKTMTLDQAISRYSQWATQLKDDGTKMYSQVTYGRYARGSYSLDDDKIALVADPQNPSNREMVVGSKLNMGQGVTGKFQKGTGIIPHGQNLTESLVRLGVWANGGGLQRAINNNSNSEINNHFHIENINLPSVKNGEDFVKYLENNFMNDAIQYSNIRGV